MFRHVGFFCFRWPGPGAGNREDVDGERRFDEGATTRESSLTNPVSHPELGTGEVHVALLAHLRRFGLLRRWDDLLDEGVAAFFGLASGEAELLALSFHAGTFTPAEARTWLAERGFAAPFLVPNAGRFAVAGFDAPPAAPVGRRVSRKHQEGEWLRKTRTSFWSTMTRTTALVFAGGIGENAAAVRARICEGLGFLGIDLDHARNTGGGA